MFQTRALVLLAAAASTALLTACEIKYVKNDDSTRPVTAPKATSPVRVALYRAKVSAGDSLNAAKLHDMVRKEFDGDPMINLIKQRDVDKAEKKEKEGNYSWFRLRAQATVHVLASIRTKSGWDPNQKKFVKVPYFHIKAWVKWPTQNNREITLEEQGSLFKNMEVTRKLCDRVKKAIRG